MKGARKYIGLLIPIGFVGGRVWSLGVTSLEALQKQPTDRAAAHFKTAVMWEMWAAVVALVFVIVVVERESFDSIGFRMPGWRDMACIPFVMIATAVLTAFWVVLFVHLSGYSVSKMPEIPQLSASHAGRLFMLATEPVFEETVFRGYLIERLNSLIGFMAPAVVISALASSLMHGSWTLGLMALPLSLGAAVLYGWRRNLPACVLLHTFWMLTAFVSGI